MQIPSPHFVSLAMPGVSEWIILIGMLLLVIYAVTRIGRK